MKLILRADVSGVGNKGDVVEVANGFGRNYLLPRGLAFKATEGAQAQAAAMKRSRDIRDAAARQAAQEVAKNLVSQPVTIKVRVGGDGRLFGSVTAADVVSAVQEQTGVEIDRRQVTLDEPIKATGTHLVPVKLHADVEFPVTVEVVSN